MTDKHSAKADKSPVEIAAGKIAVSIIAFGNKILELVGFVGDVSPKVKETITKDMTPLITNIINEALTAERAEAAVVRERHDRMAALITEWSKTQVSSKRLTEAVKRYEEKK